MRRRLLIAVSVLLAVPLVLGAAGWLLLVSPLGESMVTGRIVRALSASLGGDVRLDELELSPLRGSATVRGLSVRDGRATVETLDVSSAVVRVSLFELLRRRVRVTAVDAERVVVRLRSGIEREDEPRDLDLTPVSLLSAVRVADGELVVENEQIPFAVDVKGIRILGAPSGPGRPGCRGRVQAGPIALSLADLPRQHLERATARFSWAPPRIRVPEFAVDGPSGQVTGSLTVGLTRSGFVVNGGASGVLRAERVLPPRIPEVSGALQVWSSFHAAVPGDWEVQADISDVEGLASLDILWRDVRGHVELGSGHTVLSGLRGTTAGGSQIDGVTLHVEGDDWSVEGSGRLRIPELLERASLDRTLARGTASVELAAAGSTTGGVYRWTTEGRVDAEAPRTAALAGEFSGRGGPEGSAFEYAGGWGGGALAAKVAWDEPIPRGAWRASGKLSAATGEAARPLLARIVGQAAEKGLVLPDAVIPDPAGGLDLTATVSGDDATLDVARVTGEIRDPVTAGASHERLEIGIDWSRRGDWRASGRLADRLGRGVRAEAERARHGDVAFAVHVDELPIAVIPEILDVPAAWLDEVDGRFGGEMVGRWRDGGPRARFVAAARGRVLGSGELVARASGAWTGDRVELPFVMIQGPAVRASYRGAIDLPAAGLGWSSRGDLMAELDLAAAPPSLVPAGTAGRVSARGIVEAPSDLLPAEFRGTMSWRGVRTRGLAVPDGKGLVTRRDSGLGIEAGLAGARLDALVTASDEGPRLDASIGWADVEAVELLQRVLGRETGLLLAAWTDGRAEVSGPLRDVQAWRGRGELSRLVLEGPSVVVRQERAAPFVLEPGGRVRLLEGLPLSSDALADVGLTIGGWVDLFGPEAGRIELTGTGIADLRLIEVLDPDLVATGTVETSVEASGTLASPRFSGAITLRDGRVRHLTLNEALDGVAARAVLDGSRVRIESAECRLGGGTLKLNNMRRGENEIVLAGWLPDRVDVSVLARDVALSLPRMVFGRYDADLTIVGAASEPEINGDVVVLAGRYARPFGFGRLIGSRTRLLDPGVGISSWMSRVGLRVRLLADESFVVDNDMARLETSVRLGVGGTLGQPLLSGTISLLDGGRIDFRGVEYEVLSGQVLLDDLDENPVRLRVRAATEISGYRVRLDLDASTEEVDYQLSSTPALTEADILSLLVSGETLAERGGGSGLIGADMATAYFGSEIGELLLSGAAERLLGLTHFQLAPSRVGPEARPTARLTLGRRIDDRTLALYSRDLSSEGEDIYRLERELTRRLRLSLSQESLGGVGVDLRWLKRIGEAAAGETASARPSETLASVTVRGLPGGVDAPSTRRLGLRRGKRLRRADRLEAREALRRVLVGNGYLEAVIDDETERREDGKVDLVFDVAPGDRWLLVSEGPGRRSRRAEELLVDLWTTTLFRPELLREAERVIKEAFGEEGFAAASIEVLRPDPGERRIVVRVDPGPRVTVGDVKLEGVDLLRERDVRTQILSRPASGLGLLSRTTYKPRLELEDVSAIRALYESRGYLEARVDSRVRFKRDGSEVVLTFVVDEGAQARVGRVRVEGPWPEELGPATPRALEILEQENGAGLERDERRREPVFLPENFERARRALRSALDDAGYYEAKVTARPELSDGEVHVTFGTSPGPRGVVEEVRLERLERTRERLVRSAIRLEPGEPLTQRAIRETERALFRLGLFRDVDVAHGPAGDDPERRIVTITFQEIPPVSFLGTIGFDTEERLRATAAVSHDNIAGMGRTGTLQGFASDRQVGARVTLEDPTLLKQRVEGLVSLGWLEEEREGFDLESVELALEVGSRRNRTSRWRAGYELRDDRFHNVELDPDALAEVLLSERGRLEPIRLGSLRGSWLHDRRDDPFLPGSGWIARSDVGVWARPLASEAEFVQATGQLAGYTPWSDRVSFAGSIRVGGAWPTGDDPRVPLSERFFAGGADTIRGFDRDKLGPLDMPGGEPFGGESVVLVNLEGRLRLSPRFELATFVDAGNLWLTANELDLGDLRKTWGLDVRFRSAVGALRLGYARKIDALPSESSGELYIAIGESF